MMTAMVPVLLAVFSVVPEYVAEIVSLSVEVVGFRSSGFDVGIRRH